MARWPKEQPSTWYSQFKRGSLVSARALPACRTAGLTALHGTWPPRATRLVPLRPNRSTARDSQTRRRRPLLPCPRQCLSAREQPPRSAGPRPAPRATAGLLGTDGRGQEQEGLVLPSPAGRSWATPLSGVLSTSHPAGPCQRLLAPKGASLIPELAVGVSVASRVAVSVRF